MVVDQADQPSLEVVALLELNEERAFDVDVPELVGLAALKPRASFSRQRRTSGAETVEQSLNPALANVSNLPSTQLGGDPFRIPVGEQTDGDDNLFNPVRVSDNRLPRPPTQRTQRLQPTPLVGGLPTEQAGSTAFAKGQCCRNAILPRDLQDSRSPANLGHFTVHRLSRRRAATTRG